MCADKRIHVGDRMKYMPMGYFNSHSLGYITSTVTTIIGDVENNAPSVLITVIHGNYFRLENRSNLHGWHYSISVL